MSRWAWQSQPVSLRRRLTCRRPWEMQDEDVAYSGKELNRSVVNPDQIRTVVRTFRARRPGIFPRRREIPKTPVFAKTDNHADGTMQAVREEFGEGNQFCKKITYREEYPRSVPAQFCNDYCPRIAVTVDMVATGCGGAFQTRHFEDCVYSEQTTGRPHHDGICAEWPRTH